jgi:hypothetical protein
MSGGGSFYIANLLQGNTPSGFTAESVTPARRISVKARRKAASLTVRREQRFIKGNPVTQRN